jgi:ketosteroid isomerase-like protein
VIASQGNAATAEKEIWSCEQRYWDLLAAASIDEYMSLWHDEFTGWPPSRTEPVTKAGIRDAAMQSLANIRPGSYRARVQPLSIRIHGDFAFVFYRVAATGIDLAGNPFDERYRIHHTWWRTPNGWKIIEGMGAEESA